MKRFLPATLLILGCTLQFSCSQLKQEQEQSDKQEETTTKTPPPLYLGSVHQVFSGDKFALLRIIGPLPPEGTVLITHPADGSVERMGNLIVSSAQHARNNIIAADIRAGVVAKGDRVFRYRSISAAAEPEEEEAPQASTLSGEELDLGYVPDGLKQLMERNAENSTPAPNTTEEQTEYEPEPEQSPEESETAPQPEPSNDRGLPKFDDIPDDISGWDSM